MSIKVIKSKDVNTWLKQKAKNYYESGRMYAKSRSFISEVVQKEKERLVLPLCHTLQSYGQSMWQDLVNPLSEFHLKGFVSTHIIIGRVTHAFT